MIKAILRKNEDTYIKGYSDVEPEQLFDFRYDNKDDFFIIIGDKAYSEVSTAFDFVQTENLFTIKYTSAQHMPTHDKANLFYSKVSTFSAAIPNRGQLSKRDYIKTLQSDIRIVDREYRAFVEAVEATDFLSISRDNLTIQINF